MPEIETGRRPSAMGEILRTDPLKSAVPDAVRVGLCGYGLSGRIFHAPLIKAVPSLELALVASSDPGKVLADHPGMAVASDPFEAVTSEQVDLVAIATPNESHAPLARAALMAGKHVVIDKPFAVDLAEARDLSALASRNGLLLSVFHNRRWDSDFLTVQRAVEDGLIGEVTHFESHFDRFRPEVWGRWREQARPGSGLWLDVGPHLVDQALQLFGLPDRVHGNLARQRQGAVVDDWAHVVLDYGERRVVLHAASLTAGGVPRFVAHGTGGSLVKKHPDRQELQLRDGLKPGGPGWGEDPDQLVVFDRSGISRSMPASPGDQRCFYWGIAETLRNAATAPVPAIQALAVMAVMEAAALSARHYRSVEPLLDAEERSKFEGSRRLRPTACDRDT